MKLKNALISMFGFAVASQAMAAYVPQLSINNYGLFLSGSGYEIPSNYFQQQTLSKYEGGTDNYVLKTNPTNMSGPAVNTISQWNSSNLALPPVNSWYYIYNAGYASITEQYGYQGQCVAFAKALGNTLNGLTVNVATARWYSNSKVIPPVSQLLYSDISSQHAGKVVAFFGTSAGVGKQFPQPGSGGTGHVGVFLKYAYDKALPPYQIIGFWIADENYEGTANSNNPDGKIRKHLIKISPIPNSSNYTAPHTYAAEYWFLEVR